MQISVSQAHDLAVRVMQAASHGAEYAGLIADHLVDCELRGLQYGGLPRLVSIVERLQRTGAPRKPVELVHETPVSARLNGHDNLGYVVAHKATEIAIQKCREIGLAMVGADDTVVHGHAVLLRRNGSGRGHGHDDRVQHFALGSTPRRGRWTVWHQPDLLRFPDEQRSGDLGYRHVINHACGSRAGEADG